MKESGAPELVVDMVMVRSKEQERKKDDLTAHLYGEGANTVLPKSIRMEVDFPSAHSTGRIPILDMEVWVSKELGSKEQEISRISFNHHSKPVASKDVIYERSAFTTREKKNILLEDASRRLRNCSPGSWLEEQGSAPDHLEPADAEVRAQAGLQEHDHLQSGGQVPEQPA